jgi:NhaA family Na+:H+ antiporter
MDKPQPDTSSSTLLKSFEAFFKIEVAGGIILLVCTIVALVWANSPWAANYHALWQTPITIGIGPYTLSKGAFLWINDGLMAIFFFVVGLEIKREFLVVGLSTPSEAVMPIAAALGGMVVPAILFAVINTGEPTSKGWGIPMATDIAFALGVLSLLGKRASTGLKLFLTAVAIVDDIGAILVIALFYTAKLNLTVLAVGVGALAIMALLNTRWGVRSSLPYLLLGIVVWLAFLKSGIHATMAGVLAAMTIPASTKMDCSSFVEELRNTAIVFENAITPGKTVLTNKEQQAALHALEDAHAAATTPLQNIEHALHPWVSFCIMPLFALANAGVAIPGGIAARVLHPEALGIITGLIIGKQVGITGICWLVNRLGWASFPSKTGIIQLYGASCLAGIGFTMSIFIANLAFGKEPQHLELAKVAVLIASVVAGVFGYLVLRMAADASSRRRNH